MWLTLWLRWLRAVKVCATVRGRVRSTQSGLSIVWRSVRALQLLGRTMRGKLITDHKCLHSVFTKRSAQLVNTL